MSGGRPTPPLLIQRAALDWLGAAARTGEMGSSVAMELQTEGFKGGGVSLPQPRPTAHTHGRKPAGARLRHASSKGSNGAPPIRQPHRKLVLRQRPVRTYLGGVPASLVICMRSDGVVSQYWGWGVHRMPPCVVTPVKSRCWLGWALAVGKGLLRTKYVRASLDPALRHPSWLPGSGHWPG
jgi:hypothetical protein